MADQSSGRTQALHMQQRHFGLYLPEQLAQNGGGELRVLPAAEAQQLHRLLRVAAVLDDLLHVAGPHEEDLGHQLLHRHHRRRQVGVAVRVRQRRVAWMGWGETTLGQTLENAGPHHDCAFGFCSGALSSEVCVPADRQSGWFGQSQMS